MSNIYHLLSFVPSTDREDMLSGHEVLARQLVKSGRFRIDAGNKINFARFFVPDLNISMMFSYRELYDQALIPRTREFMLKSLASSVGSEELAEGKVDHHFDLLKAELHKYQKISEDEEMRLARLVVQAAHPVVIMLILLEKVEVFLSHSYNIGDMLDVVNWQSSGSNNGMQSTDGRDVAVFISCGGDPLGTNEDPNATYGDGWPAKARLLVVAGQEIGHYSDIMRDSAGKQISRYSANFSCTKAKEHVRLGRLADIVRGKEILKILKSRCYFEELMTQERAMQFFRQNKRFDSKVLWEWLKWRYYRFRFFRRINREEFTFVYKFADNPYTATFINAMIDDMLFNLTPVADAYQRENKEEEEAIACVEAVARVPQQRNKWGKRSAKAFMSNLYIVYYGEIIPGCIKAYENIAGKAYSFDESKEKSSLLYKIKKLFSRKVKLPMYLEKER